MKNWDILKSMRHGFELLGIGVFALTVIVCDFALITNPEIRQNWYTWIWLNGFIWAFIHEFIFEYNRAKKLLLGKDVGVEDYD